MADPFSILLLGTAAGVAWAVPWSVFLDVKGLWSDEAERGREEVVIDCDCARERDPIVVVPEREPGVFDRPINSDLIAAFTGNERL
mmetsp:Transcript_30618/g.99529  ORF Transcript_30618/g.99529 Transcript_30618/m.99529 type:complete len:86 (+) Transcript_30618:129-386(+)